MKKWKIILKIVLFLGIYVGGQALVKYALVDDTNTISRIMLHDLYTEEKNIDVLFCGASHCQLGFNTEVTDDGFGMNTFNAGSSSQGLETSLALIKEAEQYHDLKQVYVDLDYSIVMRQEPNLESIYIISDYMKPSLRKVSYLLNATSFDYYLNSFMPLHKGRGYTKNPQKILEILKKKSAPGYRSYTDRDPSYAGKGHIASRTVVEEGSLWSQDGFVTREFEIPGEQREYLAEIISFCEEKEIQLTFVSVPVTDFHLALLGNYDEYVDAVRDFLADYNVDYYDFNLCRQDMLPLTSDSYFNDDNHLNQDGSRIFDSVFADFFSGKIEENELFWDSYEQKMAYSDPRVLGLIVQRSQADDSEVTVTPVLSNEKIDAVCEVERRDNMYHIRALVDGIETNRVEIRDEELR